MYPSQLITTYMRIADEMIREIVTTSGDHPITNTPTWTDALQLIGDVDRAVQLVGYIRAMQLLEELAPELLHAHTAPSQTQAI